MILHNNVFRCLRENSDFGNLLDYAENNGIYFKEKNNPYWYPSLNAGIPITKKPDIIHQSTYVLHDVVHCVLPDPLPTTTKPIYVLTKILGEILSNVVADGYGIDILAKSGFVYDFSKRQVYPLFKAIVNNGHTVKEAVILMFRYVSYEVVFESGRDLLYSLVPEMDRVLVDRYLSRYNYFFNTDIVWNYRNYTKYFETDLPFFSDQLSTNKHLLKNEHYFYSHDDLYTFEEVITLFISHMEEVMSGRLSAKGDGKLLGDALSKYEVAGLPSVYPHITMVYGSVYEDEVQSVRKYLQNYYTL